MSQWVVVGGADKGGILVREGEALKSPAADGRLSTGAIIEELEQKGDRLHYKLVKGEGPAEGWVALAVSGKTLVEPYEETEEIGTSGEPGPVEVDEDLKKKIAAEAEKFKGKFDLYVPKFKVFGGPLEKPKLRLICFHNAGGAESTYTGPGTPIFKWIKEKPQCVEMLAVDYPGRDKLLKEKMHKSTTTLAPELLAVLWDKMNDGVPYVVWSHSVGTWVCFEFLMLARKCGLPMPKTAFFNAFPAPHMEVAKRPWPLSAKLDDAGLRKALVNWDEGHLGPTGPGKVVFDDNMWKGGSNYEQQMRHDFPLFDEYKFKHTGAPKFEFNIHSLFMEGEYYNKKDMCELWGDWTSGKFDFTSMAKMGHLTCFYNPEYKGQYFTKVLEIIKEECKDVLA